MNTPKPPMPDAPASEALWSLPYPLLVVDDDLRVHHQNAATRDFLSPPERAEAGQKCGEVLRCLHALRALPRHRRLERLGERTADHAIVNDDAHDYALLTYYIDAQAQHEQLAARGFTVLDTYSLDGRPCLTTAEGPDGTASSCWLTYVAQAQ